MNTVVVPVETLKNDYYWIFTERFDEFQTTFRLGIYAGIGTQIVLGFMIVSPTIRAVILLAIPKLVTSKLRAIFLLFLISWSFQVNPYFSLNMRSFLLKKN